MPSPTQYRYLLETEKIVEKRALEQKGGPPHLPLVVTCVICFAISAFFTSMPFLLPMDTFTYALTGITISMMMIGLWTIPYFDILLSPINYPVIAHTPVSSRTYFLVKLTQVATYTVLVISLPKPDACYRWYLDSRRGIFSVSISFPPRLFTDRLYVRSFHNRRDDGLRRVFDKNYTPDRHSEISRNTRSLYFPCSSQRYWSCFLTYYQVFQRIN